MEKNSSTIGEYVYDGNGRRLLVTENGATTTFIYLRWSVLYEETSAGTASYVYGPTGQLLAKRTTVDGESETFYYHIDHLGSSRLVTDTNKIIVTAVTYHPFGEISVKEGSEDYLFTGRELDSTELYYFGARYYDPDIGRFITRDSWTYLPNDSRSTGKVVAQWLDNDSQVFNRYSYCRNNPLGYIDPSGHGWLAAIATGLLLLATLVICIVIPPAGVFLTVWAYACLTILFYEHIYAVWRAMSCSVNIKYSTKDHVTGVDWFDLDANQIGGWYEIYDPDSGEMLGYNVWSTEQNAWVFVPKDQWTPPPPPLPGEPTEPVTYEGIKDELNSQDDGSSSSASGSSSQGASSPTQRGAMAGRRAYAV